MKLIILVNGKMYKNKCFDEKGVEEVLEMWSKGEGLEDFDESYLEVSIEEVN